MYLETNYYIRYSEDQSRVCPKCDVTRRQTSAGSRIVYISEKRARQTAENATVGLSAAASQFMLTGWFHILLTRGSGTRR